MNLLRRALNSGHLAALAWVDRQVPFWPPGRVEWLQRRRLRDTIAHAYATVPFYRRVMDERGLRPTDFQTIADLEKLPLLDDAIVRRDPEQFVSRLYGPGARHALHTSGTQSGHRTSVYWDAAALLRQLAHHERDRMVLNRLLGQDWGQEQMFILPPVSTSLWIRAYWDERVLMPRGMVRRHVASANEPYEYVVERINAIRPAVVFSYGSYAEHFARYVTDRGLDVARPRVWMYGADMLSEAGREMLERKLGCVVYSTYQSAEVGRLGFQCERRRGFHLNVDLCALRLIDEEGRAAPAGERGEVVISSLSNRAMVLLNHRLGDLAVLSPEPCPCGRTLPLLERLEGRRAETICLSDGRAISVQQVENACCEELKVTLAAQLGQPAQNQLRWRIVPFSDIDRKSLRRRLAERTTQFLGGQFEVTVEFVSEIPCTPQGKFRRVTGPHGEKAP